MINLRGGGFMDDIKYLNACGFKKGDDGKLIFNERSFYPKLSCILVKGEDEGGEADVSASYEFVLHYSPDEGYMRTELHFKFEEVEEVRSSLCDGLGKYFSLSDSFLRRVRASRANGQKHWKKRHFPLPFKKAKIQGVLGIFETEEERAERIEGEVGYSREVAWSNMQYWIGRSVKEYSLAYFEHYYDDWKFYYSKVGRNLAFNEFKKAVEDKQVCS